MKIICIHGGYVVEWNKEIKMAYYHMCQIPLEKGSIIKPGNYGRMLEYDKGRNLIIYNSEIILEGIREKL